MRPEKPNSNAKQALDDPAVLAVIDQFDQPVIYMDTGNYTKFARDTLAAEKVLVERLGLANKGNN